MGILLLGEIIIQRGLINLLSFILRFEGGPLLVVYILNPFSNPGMFLRIAKAWPSISTGPAVCTVLVASGRLSSSEGF